MKIKDKDKAYAVLNKIRVSPRKLNLVAQMIRGLPVNKALDVLVFSKKRVALDVKKTLMSAIANAENNHGLQVDRLYVDEAFVGTSLVLKRFQARAKGRGVGIKKRFANLSVIVAQKEV